VEHVNAEQTEAELAAVRRSVQCGNPFGAPSWSDEMVRRLGREGTIRPQGRPKKSPKRFLPPFPPLLADVRGMGNPPNADRLLELVC